jgi:hypothetical protein
MESVVEKAKIEVNAYATATIQRAGLTAIAEKNGDAPVTLLMPEKPKDERVPADERKKAGEP